MKTFLKIVLVVLTFTALVIFGVQTSGASEIEYTVSADGGEYVLSYYVDGTLVPAYRSASLSDVVTYVEESGTGACKMTFLDVSAKENISFTRGSFTLIGRLKLSGGAITVSSGDVTLTGVEIELSEDSRIRVKNGKITVNSGTEIVSDGCAIVLDRTSKAEFVMRGGIIRVNSESSAIKLTSGSADILGGKIENSIGACIENSSTLILSGIPELESKTYDIITDKPIILNGEKGSFKGNTSVKYLKEFSEGSIECVFYEACDALSGIELYDVNGNRCPIKFFESFSEIEEENFGAVYLPFLVRYIVRGEVIHTEEVLSGCCAPERDIPRTDGYKGVGWSVDGEDEVIYDFNENVNKSIDLHAVYRLLPPSFQISSMSFSYDGREHKLQFDSVSHPLGESGVFNYLWYKDGESLGISSDCVSIKNVSDSGEYSCRLTFTYGSESVFVMTSSVEVYVQKKTVDIPEILPKEYNGEAQRPDVFSSTAFTVSDTVGTHVGTYPLILTLSDPENYVFSGVDGETVALDFVIVRARNFFTEGLSVSDVYEGNTPSPTALARFGSVTYKYSSEEDGVYTDSAPTLPGIYYVIAESYETENYFGVKSAPVPFSVIREEVVGISIFRNPDKCDYTAFDSFLPDGLILSVTYNSGRVAQIKDGAQGLLFLDSEVLLAQKKSVTAVYGGSSVAIPIRVEKKEYDLSGVSFSDVTAVYNGSSQSITYIGALPTGLDGIPLAARVIGCGENAGTYKIILEFASESPNYRVPESREATLTVQPYMADAVWSGLSFVYDSEVKCPSAYYTDIYGRKITLEVNGGKSRAGRYTAVAVSSDPNYVLRCDSAEYVIEKADYSFEGVFWTSSEFVYDGEEKSVFVFGLPEGVEVIGYSDNKAIFAGSYTAKATLLYDTENYNPPPSVYYSWSIEKAEYEIGGYSFHDNAAVYNGEIHYPIFKGNMPAGIDGSVPKYTFERGAVHVSEGRVLVKIDFFTESKNYNPPKTLFAYVEILPMEISVLWENTEFIYSTATCRPSAYSELSEIAVLGGAVDAGEYTALAISKNSDYKVINGECKYVIKKAPNLWIKELSVPNIFAGAVPMPKARAHAGEVYYLYYSDSELLNKIEIPKGVGRYYVVAVSPGDRNYGEIKSEPAVFEIKEVVPISLFVSLNKTDYSAFEKIGGGDISAHFLNNDGSITYIASDALAFDYGTADSLRAGNFSVTVSCGAFSKEIALSVSKADYDLSLVKWSEKSFIYDGEEKVIQLLGLPSGIEIIGYIGSGGKDVGEYSIEAVIEYDRENYNTPVIPLGFFKIEKRTVALPTLSDVVYCGSENAPEIEENEIWKAVITKGVGVGKYPVRLTLKDSKNYVFENGGDTAEIHYEILPMKLTVVLSDVNKFLFEEISFPKWEITDGEIFSGDDIMLEFFFDNGEVYAKGQNPNYELTVVKGKIHETGRLSEDGVLVLFLILFFFFLLLTFVFLFFFRRDVLIRFTAKIKYRFSKTKLEPYRVGVKKIEDISSKNSSAEGFIIREISDGENQNSADNTETAESDYSDISLISDMEGVLSVDTERADALISDSLAKDLVRRDVITVYTDGKSKRVINVDTISDNFSSGDTVDVNKLKEMSLVPYDTAYIKVLARGMIDKPLRVYANDFSLAAVKMIALTGGEAIKVITLPKKKKEVGETGGKE